MRALLLILLLLSSTAEESALRGTAEESALRGGEDARVLNQRARQALQHLAKIAQQTAVGQGGAAGDAVGLGGAVGQSGAAGGAGLDSSPGAYASSGNASSGYAARDAALDSSSGVAAQGGNALEEKSGVAALAANLARLRFVSDPPLTRGAVGAALAAPDGAAVGAFAAPQQILDDVLLNEPPDEADEADEAGEEAAEETERLIVAYVAFFLMSLLGAAVLQWLVSLVPRYQLPASIAWFLYGMGLDVIFAWWPTDEQALHNSLVLGVQHVATMNAEIVYLVLLPILLYEAALNVDWHKFKRFAISGTTLAVFGVAYQIAFVGTLVQISFPSSKLMTSRTSWFNSFLIGSSLASTDPVAVISVLNSLQAPPKLSTMFDGESLINDGTSMLLFQFFKSLAHGNTETAGAVIGRFATLLLLSPVWGTFCCWATYVWLRRCHLSAPAISIAPLAVAYVVYLVGEKVLRCSGPLAIVAFGLCWNAFGHIGLERHAQEHHHHAVQSLANLANSSVFVVAGVVAMRMMHDSLTADDGISSNEIWNVPILYAYLLAARASMVLLCMPILRKTGYGVNWKESLLLIWGGLRGAIVLAMGLMIEQDFAILKFMRYEAVLYIAGSTFLILCINGATFELLYNLLTPYPPKPFRRVYLEKIMKLVDLQYMQERAVLEDHWLFRHTDTLRIADATAPILGWRKINDRGRINVNLPSVATAFKTPPDMSNWQPPPECFAPTGPNNCSPNSSQEAFPAASAREIPGVTDVPGTLDAKLLIQVAEATAAAAQKATQPAAAAAATTDAGASAAPAPGPPTPTQPQEEVERAQDVASSAQGLRGAKKQNFDAKYYLRLLEHVNEPPIASPRTEGDGRHLSPESGGGGESPDDAQIKRFDTDKTVVLPNVMMLSSQPRRQRPLGRFRKIFSGPVRGGSAVEGDSAAGGGIFSDEFPRLSGSPPSGTFRDFASAIPTRSYSLHRRGEGDRPQRARLSHELRCEPSHSLCQEYHGRSSSSCSRSRISRAARTEFDSYLGSRSNTGRLAFREDPQHLAAAAGGHDSPHRVGFAIPSAASEPFGTSRLDVGRMTRLRRPEWDSRASRSNLSGLPPYTPSGQGALDDVVVYRRVSPTLLPNLEAEDPYAQSNLMNFHALQQALHQHGEDSTRKRRLIGRLRNRMLRRGAKGAEGEGIARVTSAPCSQLEAVDPDDLQSIDSNEEYLMMPNTPARLLRAAPAAATASLITRTHQAAARVKVLRKEREGELFIMVFNALRQMYRKLYQQHFIGGAAMLSLGSTLDHATDFAIGKLRRNHVRAWRDVLSSIPEDLGTEWVTHVPGVGEGMTGFEFEWRALVTRLRCIDRRNVLGRLLYKLCPDSTWMRASCSFASARCDIEQLVAFVDVHEELLFKGGDSLAELLGPRLLGSYRRAILDAKKFVLVLRAAYPEAFPYTVAVHASTLLIHLKKQLVEEQYEKGLIIDDDFKLFIELLEEQIRNLEAFRPGGFGLLLTWLKERALCWRKTELPAGSAKNGGDAFTTAGRRQTTTTQCES